MCPRNSKSEIRNKPSAQTTKITTFLNWFAASDLFRVSRFGFAVALVPAFCSAAVIPINNPSFETTDSTPVAGWGVQPPNTDGAAGGTIETFIYAPTVDAAGTDYPGGIPGGVNVAHSDGPIIFQNLVDPATGNPILAEPDMVYTLTYYVGNSANINDFVGYRAILKADGLVITTNQTKPIPTAGTFVQATSTGSVMDDQMIGQPISIVLEPLGGQVDWDDVLMSVIPNEGPPVTPEPASMALLAIAAPILAVRRRKSSNI